MGLFSGVANALGIGGASGVNTSYVNPAQINQAYKNTQTGLQQQQDLLKALQAQNGIQNQSNVFGQEQQLANALQLQSQGQGPSVAQAALANQTGANVAQQAALAAGQRGAGANAGLIARQAGQQGAGIQQQAVGQGAELRAQEQLAAQQQLQAQQAQMAGLSTSQVGQQQGAVNAYEQDAQNQLTGLMGGQAAANQAAISNQGLQNQGVGAILGGIGSIGGLFSGPAKKAHGGIIEPHLQAIQAIYHPHMAHGGKVPVMVSPGEAYLSPKDVQDVSLGKKEPLSSVQKFEGKAKYKGDNPENDILPRNLDPGGMVLPRTVVNSENPDEESKNFIAKELSKKGDIHGDFHEALKKAIEHRIKK